MKKRTFLYIPLVLLFIITLAAFAMHAARIYPVLSRAVNVAAARSPFLTGREGINELRPEGEAAGLKKGDRVVEINGRALTSDEVFYEELLKTEVGDPINLTVERSGEAGAPARQNITARAAAGEISFWQRFSDFSITLIFHILLPGISFLLGFYVAFLRPRDPQAWILLFLLLGIGAIGMEGGREGGLVRVFQETAMNFVGIAMMLFGIYFPERLDFDRRHPVAKWILLLPLGLAGICNLFEQIGRFFGWRWLWEGFDRFTSRFDSALTILTMIAMGMFFAALATKSATLENKDSRRRLRILYVGTTVAMLPALIIILYRIISGREGGFFELVPSWFAIFALVAILLFPLTMAYVIVIQRAMDVSVVVRQGLRYALAKNGVIILQILLSFGVILTAVSFVSAPETNRPQRITFIALGITGVFLIRILADKIRIWVDRKFFREAYNAEQILSDLSEEVRTMVETEPLLEKVSTRISESLHVPQVALLLKNGAAFQPAHALGYETLPPVVLPEDAKTVEKLKKNETLVIYQDDEDSWINEEIETEEREKLRELNSQLLLPVGAKNELSGVISLSPKLSEEPYSANDLRLLKSVAAQTGLALENSRLTETIAREAAQKERLNRELEIAREVQERLFPQELPPVEGLDYYGACRPALGVGGDYYDFLELPDGKFGIAIGDISGKGIGASLMMASLQASLRGQTIHFKEELAEMMRHVNTLLYEASTSNRYATFFYAQYEPQTRKLIYVNAGHNPPFLIRAGGDVLKLEEGGAVVGMLPSMLVFYKQGEIQLQPGDVIVGFTDGISEAMNPAEEEWGEDAMLAELKKITGKSAKEILHHIVAQADKFANGARQHDDMTMIVVRVL